MANSRYIDRIMGLLETIDTVEKENIEKAGTMMAETIMNGGILITFGSGHSIVGAKEIVSRAGGLFPAKMIRDPSEGIFEKLEGSGTIITAKTEILPEDLVIIISNSGRNPAGIEIALKAREIGAKVLAVTSVESSKQLKSRHSSGKRLFEVADLVLDMHSEPGDASMTVEGIKEKVCGTSTVATVALLQSSVLYAVEYMVSKGFNPPIRISANVDGGTERSLEIEKKYAHRIYRL